MKTIRAAAAAAMLALAGAGAAQAGIVLSFTPSMQHVAIGQMATVDVRISGLGSEILSAVDLNFLYDGAVMGSTRLYDQAGGYAQLGGSYGANPVYVVDVDVLGEYGVQASAVASDAVVAANQADDFLFAQLSFVGDADGVSTLTLGPDPDFQRNFVGLNGLTLDVSVGSACIAVGTGVCEVPEPGSTPLVALALGGLLLPALRRRRRG